jgi:hypothetical protein
VAQLFAFDAIPQTLEKFLGALASAVVSPDRCADKDVQGLAIDLRCVHEGAL